MYMYLLEERYNLGGKHFCSSEALGVQHHLSNELSVWLCHGKTSEEKHKWMEWLQLGLMANVRVISASQHKMAINVIL